MCVRRGSRGLAGIWGRLAVRFSTTYAQFGVSIRPIGVESGIHSPRVDRQAGLGTLLRLARSIRLIAVMKRADKG